MKPKVNAIACAALCVFCVIFMIVYYQFSHDVKSPYMTFMWAIPAVLGVVPYTIMTIRQTYIKSALAAPIYNSGIVTLTVGSCFMGVLEIFGTTNPLSIVYPIVGGVLLVLGAIIMFLKSLDRQDS